MPDHTGSAPVEEGGARSSNYLVDFARKSRRRSTGSDGVGNVVMRKPATAGLRGPPGGRPAVPRGHGVREEQQTWSSISTTTRSSTRIDGRLGHGRQVRRWAPTAASAWRPQLAVHGFGADVPARTRWNALFTVDEETGLTGAFGLGEDMLSRAST